MIPTQPSSILIPKQISGPGVENILGASDQFNKFVIYLCFILFFFMKDGLHVIPTQGNKARDIYSIVAQKNCIRNLIG